MSVAGVQSTINGPFRILAELLMDVRTLSPIHSTFRLYKLDSFVSHFMFPFPNLLYSSIIECTICQTLLFCIKIPHVNSVVI